MTERSTFSATQGIKKARKQAKKQQEDPDFHIPPVESKKFTPGFGGVDGSQILPPKNQYIMDNLNRERPPLHVPKTTKSPKKQRPVPKKNKSPSPVQAPVAQQLPPREEEHENPKDLVDQQLNDM